MSIDDSTINILMVLLKNTESYISIKNIANLTKLSERSVRYLIGKIEEFLKNEKLGNLDKKWKNGYKLNVTNDELKNLNIKMKNPKILHSKNERIGIILSELISSRLPLKIQYFTKILNVSQNTITNDLSVIEASLKDSNLDLVKKRGIGVYLVGHEFDKRKLLTTTSLVHLKTTEVLGYLYSNEQNPHQSPFIMDNVFSDININYIDHLLRDAEDTLQITFTDESYSSMLIHLCIMIKRIRIGKPIVFVENELDKKQYLREFETAKYIKDRICQYYDMRIPDDEESYIALHLIGANVTYSSDYILSNLKKLKSVVNTIIENVEHKYNIKFKLDENKLLEDLMIHLRPAVNRINLGINIVNPMFDEIVSEYPQLFQITKASCIVLEEFLGKTISDDEIAYIALHFGAALKNENQKIEPFKVLLVCATGIGTSKMLISQLKARYIIDIVGSCGVRNIVDVNESKYKYIISTLDIPARNNKKIIRVSPILNKNDFKILDKVFANKYGQSYQVDIDNVVEEIFSIFEKNKRNNKDELKMKVHRILDKSFGEQDKPLSKKLLDFLTIDSIKTNVHVSTYQEAIDYTCSILEDNKSINKEYHINILKTLEIYGNYYKIMPNTVLLHAENINSVYKTDMALVILDEPVKLSNTDEIQIFIIFSSLDGHEHFESLKELTYVLSEYKITQRLLECKSSIDVIQIINTSLKKRKGK